MNINKKTVTIVVLAVLTALLVLMTITPIGYIPITPVIGATLNMIPVAIGAIVIGPVGGAVLGGVFGLTAVLNALGVMGAPSLLGTTLMGISPARTVVVCIVPRVLFGFLIGLIFKGLFKVIKPKAVPIAITGFLAAALNTVFFMMFLIICFTPALRDLGVWNEGVNVFAFVAGFVGVNALLEMAASTVITTIVGFALYKARLVGISGTNRK